MEFIVSRNALLQALNHVRCAIFAKSNAPICKSYIFSFPEESDNKLMVISASDGDQWLSETVQILPNLSSADSPSEFRTVAVEWYSLLKSIRSLDEQPLTFRVGEYQMTISHSVGSFKIPLATSSYSDFINCKPCPDAEAEDGYRIEYEVPGMRSILNRCKFTVAHDELRPAMNGVYVNLTEEYADYVASDGHRLVRVRKNPVCQDGKAMSLSFIIPAKVVNTILKILPAAGDITLDYQKELKVKETKIREGEGETYTVCERRAMASITIDDKTTISFYPVDSRYPNYNNVIPLDFNYEMSIDRRLLIKSVDRLSLFTSDSGMIVISIEKDKIHLCANYVAFGMGGEESIPCEFKVYATNLESVLRLGANSSNLSSILKAIQSENVIFKFQDASRGFVIMPEPQPDVEEITMLLMPMLLSD